MQPDVLLLWGGGGEEGGGGCGQIDVIFLTPYYLAGSKKISHGSIFLPEQHDIFKITKVQHSNLSSGAFRL
jgi:hypothetical protein